MSEQIEQWWDKEDPRVKKVARQLVRSDLHPDTIVQPETLLHVTLDHQIHVFEVEPELHRPLWTYYISTAKFALDAAKDLTNEDEITDITLPPVKTANELWRQQRGFDYGE
jgi:hypothetical protein